MIGEKNINSVIDNEERIRMGTQKRLRGRSLCDTLHIEDDIINTLVKSILGKNNYYDIAWEIVVNVTNYLKCEDCVVYLIREDGRSMEQIAAFGNKVDEKKIINQLIIPIGEGIVGTVAKTGIPELIHDTSKDIRYIQDIESNFSEITVPIILNGEVIGIIDSEHKEKNYYTYDHVLTLTNISRIIAKQLNNAVRLEKRIENEKLHKRLNEQLKRKNKSLEEFAHIVSHDLKSPLRNISALVEWIKQDNIHQLDSPSLQHIQQIEWSLEHMEKLLKDVLVYSNIEKSEIKKSVIDIRELLENSIEAMDIPLNSTLKVGNMPHKICTDPAKIIQVFQNLITNALTYNDKEKCIVTIEYTALEDRHQFTVTDNGMGIDEKYFDKIFKVFQSLDKVHTSTGIGLSVAEKIVRSLQGEIWLESTLGKGTTFYFTVEK